MFFLESDLLSSSYSASPFYLAAHYDIITESQTILKSFIYSSFSNVVSYQIP